jgi:hypothetical protein
MAVNHRLELLQCGDEVAEYPSIFAVYFSYYTDSLSTAHYLDRIAAIDNGHAVSPALTRATSALRITKIHLDSTVMFGSPKLSTP